MTADDQSVPDKDSDRPIDDSAPDSAGGADRADASVRSTGESLPGDDFGRQRLTLFWKIGIGFAVAIAAAAGAGIGAAIVRITCDSECALPYAGGFGLGFVFGGFGTLVLMVLVARSMQEWREWNESRSEETRGSNAEGEEPGKRATGQARELTGD